MKENVITSMISVLISVVITVLCSFIMSFLLFRLHISNGVLQVLITITYMISCFTGGILSAKHKEKKYVRGFVVGNIYVLIMLICSLISHGNIAFIYNSRILIVSTICLISATLGGMLA